MNKYYYSIYGPFIEQYINTKKSLGYKFKDNDSILHRFDKLALQRDEGVVGISMELAEEWSKKKSNESEINRYKRIQALRLFSSFLCKIGYPSYISLLPKLKRTYVPYIFSKEEMNAIFFTCDQLERCYHKRTAIFMIPSLFRLLYGPGLRISEALSSSCDDVNLKDKYVIVRHTKNSRDPIVPMSDSLVKVCQQYLDYRNSFPCSAYKTPDHFFVFSNTNDCTSSTIYKWFRKVLYHSGISHGGKGTGTRLHDFRHTFSVHSLAAMAEAGMDLYYSLPILSTYLGHQTLSATDGYVRLTAQMYPSIIAAANNISPNLFPEIFNLNENETN